MARNRNDLLDDVIDMGMDALADKARDIFETVKEKAAAKPPAIAGGLPCAQCTAPTALVCAVCRRPFCYDHAEFYNDKSWAVCPPCFRFLWQSGKQKMKGLVGEVGARAAANGKSRPKPWIVLGVEPDATEKEIKKAYRKIVAESHPDVVPSEERVQAQERIDKVTRAKNAMLAAARSAERSG